MLSETFLAEKYVNSADTLPDTFNANSLQFAFITSIEYAFVVAFGTDMRESKYGQGSAGTHQTEQAA